MAARVYNKILAVAAIIVFLCGILMLGLQLDGWARLGEKPKFSQIVLAVVFLSLGTSLGTVALNHRRKVAK
jgi:hypothetical protein